MKRKIVAPGYQPQKVKIDDLNRKVEDGASDEECQIVFIKPSSPSGVDASFESLEANNNTEEVYDEIDKSVLCLEDEPQSHSVHEISSESMTLDKVGRAIENDREKKANVDQKSPRKGANLQSFPIRKKIKSGPSKFKKKYDPRFKTIPEPEQFLGARSDKTKRKEKLKTTFVDEEISFNWKCPAGHFQVSEEVSGKKESSQDCISIVDLTFDEDKEPQHNQVRNEVSQNQKIASSTSDVLTHQIFVNNHKDRSPSNDPANTLRSRSTEVLNRLVKNPKLIVTDLFKDPKHVDATKNIHVMDENVLSCSTKNTKDRVTSPISSTSLNTEASLLIDEPETQKPLNNQVAGGGFNGKSTKDKEESGTMIQENVTHGQETDNLDELVATAFKELEVRYSHKSPIFIFAFSCF